MPATSGGGNTVGKYIDSNLTKDEHVMYEAKLHWITFVTGNVFDFFSSEFAITNKRFIVKRGRLSRRSLEMNLRQIESVSVDQNILQRMMGYGTVTIAGTGGTKEKLPRITHPLEFRNKLIEALQTQQSG